MSFQKKEFLSRAIATTLLCCLCFWSLRWLSHQITPVETVYSKITRAVEKEVILANNYPWGSWYHSRDQYMDCSIVNQIFADEHLSKIGRIFLNLTFDDEASQKKIPPERVGCEIYQDLVEPSQSSQISSLEFLKFKETRSYDRYWWGAKDLLRLALRYFKFEQIKNSLRVLCIVSVLLWGISLFSTASKCRVFLTLFLTLLPLSFSGLPYFWTSWVHAPSWVLPFACVAVINFVTKKVGRLDDLEVVFLCILGSLIAYLEGLNGPLPLVIASLIVSNYLKFLSLFVGAKEFIKSLFYKLGFVLFSFLLTVAVKIFSSLFFHSDSLSDFFRQLLFRTGIQGERFSHAWRALTHAESADALFWGSKALAGYLVPALLTVLFFILSWIGFLAIKRKSQKVWIYFLKQNLSSFFLIAIFFGWILLFRNHTANHGFFMNRLFLLPMWALVLMIFSAFKIQSCVQAKPSV